MCSTRKVAEYKPKSKQCLSFLSVSVLALALVSPLTIVRWTKTPSFSSCFWSECFISATATKLEHEVYSKPKQKHKQQGLRETTIKTSSKSTVETSLGQPTWVPHTETALRQTSVPLGKAPNKRATTSWWCQQIGYSQHPTETNQVNWGRQLCYWVLFLSTAELPLLKAALPDSLCRPFYATGQQQQHLLKLV